MSIAGPSAIGIVLRNPIRGPGIRIWSGCRQLCVCTMRFEREKADENGCADIIVETVRSHLHCHRCAGARSPQTTRGQRRGRGTRHGWSKIGGNCLGAGLREEGRAERQSSGDTPVSEIMTREVVCVAPTQTNEEYMALMTTKRARHLPVIYNGRVISVLSIGDLVKDAISERRFIIDQLEHYIHR